MAGLVCTIHVGSTILKVASLVQLHDEGCVEHSMASKLVLDPMMDSVRSACHCLVTVDGRVKLL